MHSTPAKGTTYKAGEDIEVKATFTKAMRTYTTGGKPQLTLKIGTADKIAPYSGGFGTPNVRFKYRVASGDVDTDGISIDANSLELNGGTIESWTGNDATLTHIAVSAFSGHKVDAVVPRVSSVAFTSTPTNSAYAIGEKIQITATFNKNVTKTGTPQVTLKLGAGNRTATYTSGSGTKSLVFEYTVVSHDEDTDGVAIEANKLSAGTGTIRDANDTNALLTHTAVAASTLHKVDGIAPRFDGSGSSTAIALTSAGPYGPGKKITMTFQFTENVKVTGTPQLALTIGAATRNMDYKSGSDTNTLTFEYTVVAGDSAPNGLSVAANSLKLNSGSIKDAVGNAAVLTHRKSVDWIHQKVDTTAPTVSSIAITSSAQTYGVGDKIQATVTFSENVSVNTEGGIPQLTLNIGGSGKNAAYKSGDGSKTIIFEYTVAAGANDTDGISIDANKLVLNGGTIKDGTSNDATLTHAALATQASHIVDTTGPTVATGGISFTSTPKVLNTYAAGDTVQATVTFSEIVTVTGTPQLTIQIGAFPEAADYKSGSGTKSLVFETTVLSGHEDTNGIQVLENKLALNGGTIKDGADNAATLTHVASIIFSGHKVDGQSPMIPPNSVQLQTNPIKNSTYKKGEKIKVSVTFNDNVFVTGTPTLALNIGTKKQKASYTLGSGSTILFFEYTVAEGDKDTDGISIQNNALKGGTITDNVGNPALVVLTALATQATDKVDGVSPKVVANGIAITTQPAVGDTYKAGEDIQLTVTFDDTVTVVGTPKLPVEMGGADTDVNYLSGSGTKVLIFQHTVAAGEEDTDGIGVESNKLKLGSETVTIKDNIGNDAILTHVALVTQVNHKVDAIKPTVTTGGISVTSNAGADRFYTAGDKIEVQMVFSENVFVTNSPQLPLTIGSETDRNADYHSGTGTAKLKFVYKVVAGDEDTDGISIAENQLKLNDGTIKDRVGNAAVLTHAALPAQAWHKVGAAGPGVDSVAITSTSGNNYYKKDAKLQVTATFNENVTVTGTPTLTITVGTHYKKAVYTSGSGSKELVFEYTVATGDEDKDGVSVAANQITLPNGATIKDSNGNDFTLTHPPISNASAHKVDAKDPKVITNGVSITSTGAPYGIGETIQVTVTFTEPVNVTGTPQLTLRIGSKDKKAGYDSGTGTANLVFEYTVVAGDEDTDGVSIAKNSLELNGGTIKDTVGNPAALGHSAVAAQVAGGAVSAQGAQAAFGAQAQFGAQANFGLRSASLVTQQSGSNSHKVDGVKPTVSSLAITSNPPSNSTYTPGNTITVTATFSENVNVTMPTATQKPLLVLTVGEAEENATYTSGTGTTALKFQYTVKNGDTDTDGISIAADQLSLNDGTIEDTAGNTATLKHAALDTQSEHKVGNKQQQGSGSAPTVNSISLTSTATNNYYYKTGDTVQATVTFSESVSVTGTPQLTLTIGSASKEANYTTTGSTTTALVFAYTVASGDEDTDGISIAANSLATNNGTIKATDNQVNANLTHGSLSTQRSHRVDATPPTVSSVAITSTAKTYKADDIITARVTFSENLIVTGMPTLTLTIGSENRTADYNASRSGSSELVFEYTVVAGDNNMDGISIEADALSRNGGTITDAAGNTATLTHAALDAQTRHKVNTTNPTVSRVAITSTAKTYKATDTITTTVTFSEKVKVTGTPRLFLTIGTAKREASYTGGTGTTALNFQYTVATGDNDTDGISIAANKLELNGGTITNAAGNTAILTHAALDTQAAHKVATTAPPTAGSRQPGATGPVIRSLALTSIGPYALNSNIEVTVYTDQTITVSGTPTLTLVIGATEKAARYVRGSGSSALVFSYTVAAGDSDTDGIAVKANYLALAGGTLKNSDGTDLVLTHSAIADAGAAHAVDSIVPTISGAAMSSTPSNSGTYTIGEKVQATVTFSENVIVTGTPQLTLTIGELARQANWKSGTGTGTLVFEYTVARGDNDTDGVSIAANQLSLNGGTVKDLAGNAANLTYTALPPQTDHKVETFDSRTATTGDSVALTSTGPYGVGSNIEVTVYTNEILSVRGKSSVTLVVGETEKTAAYTRRSGVYALVFSYTVEAGDTDTDGVGVKANSFTAAGGIFIGRNESNRVFNLNHSGIANAGTSHAVDTASPDSKCRRTRHYQHNRQCLLSAGRETPGDGAL